MPKVVNKKRPVVVIVRHGETIMDDGLNKFQGELDEGLDNEGLAEALGLAEKLAPIEPVAIYSSDLERAEQTAEIIAEECDCEVTYASMLRPWKLGDIVGMDIEDGQDILLDYAVNKPNEPLPGGGESYNAWIKRLFDGLKFYVFDPTIKSGGPCILVDHSLNVMAICAWIDGEGEIDPEVALKQDGPPGSVMAIYYDGDDWDYLDEPHHAENY